ncbi:MAG TPA: hypothetical protein VET48_10865, partial [Steroidobacteraceae bacterium]|nr:hypothetical protein [Steroidobacteraceae bacterium]
MIPIHTTVAFVVLVSAIALAAIEIRRPWLAAVFVAPIAVAIGLTIAAWVFTFAPPFGLTIFAESSAPDWFPTRDAIEAAMPTALVSLVVLALTIDRLLPTVAPIAWATGFLLVITPPLRNAAFAVWTPVDINEAASQRVLTMSALMLLGIALMFSRRVHADAMTPIVRGGIRDDTMRGARLRAVLAVIAIATTVVLWYAVRATEVRQLRGDVDYALETIVRELQEGLENNGASADRLWQHWSAQHWQISDELFINDARIYMRRQIAVAAIAMLDRDGRVIRIARREPPFGSAQENDDVIEQSASVAPLADDSARRALVRTAVERKARVRGPPYVADNGASFTTSMMPIFDDTGALLGAFWLMHRPEVSIAHFLKDISPDFHIRLSRGNTLVLDRPPRDGVYEHEQRFLHTEVRQLY